MFKKAGKLFLKRKRRIVPSVLAAFAIPFVLFVGIPLEVYAVNMGEFLFSFSSFFGILLLQAIFFALILFLALMLLPKKPYRIVYCCLVATALLLFVQKNYLNGKMATLLGDNIGSYVPPVWKLCVNLLLWALVETAAVVAAICWEKTDLIRWITIGLSAIVLGTQTVSCLSVALTTKDVFLPRSERMKKIDADYYLKVLSTENLNTISTKNNIFYFCIDRFDEEYAETTYKEQPQVFDQLDGFTWFQDNISTYGRTFPGIAEMLTNAKYDCTQSRADYLNEVYQGETPLSVLHENGYEINLYTGPYHSYTEAYFLPDYVANLADVGDYAIHYNTKSEISSFMTKMSLYQSFPLVGKLMFKTLNSDSANLPIQKVIDDSLPEGKKQFSMETAETKRFINATSYQTTDQKLFSFIHVNGCHEVEHDKNGKISTKQQKDKVISTVCENMEMVEWYLKALKDAGVYDSATIVITGDHAAPHINGEAVMEVRQTALFIKPSGASGTPLLLSKVQAAHDNIWATVFESEKVQTDLDLQPSLFSIGENEQKTRHFVWHTWRNRARKADEYIYEITGSGGDINNWKLIDERHFDKFILD